MRVRAITAISEEDQVLPKELCQSMPGGQWPGMSMRELNAAVCAEELHKLVEERAYYHAQARGFSPGHEVEDWLAAEQEIHHTLSLDNRGGRCERGVLS